MKIVNYKEIAQLITSIQNFDERYIYDEEYAADDFFVLYEDDAIVENVFLDNYIGDQYIVGYIFMKNLEVNKQISALDTDITPFLLVLGNVKAIIVTLAGNEFYIGGNLECSTLWGIYNHGALTVKGQLTAQLLYSDDFEYRFESVHSIVIIIGDETAQYKDQNGLGLVLMTKSHALDQIFNETGLALCDSGLFEFLTLANVDLTPILKTEIDFHMDFPEKARIYFNEIFNNPIFESQQTIDFQNKAMDPFGVFYSFAKDKNINTITVINTNRTYASSIAFDTEIDKIYLDLTLYSDQTFKDKIYFQMNEEDQFFHAKTVKHWFFEGYKEWQLNLLNYN